LVYPALAELFGPLLDPAGVLSNNARHFKIREVGFEQKLESLQSFFFPSGFFLLKLFGDFASFVLEV